MALVFNFSNWSSATVGNGGATGFNVGSTNAQGANGTINQNDLLIAVVIVTDVTATADPGVIVPPAGWTQICNEFNTNPNSVFGDIDIRYACYWKVAGASETGSYAYSWTAACRGASWALFDYSDPNAVTPIDASGNFDNTVGAMVCPSISPTNPNDIMLIIGLYADNLGPYSLPGGFTQRAYVNNPVNSTSFPDIIAGDTQLSSSGPTGTKTIGFTTTGVPSGISIAIAPGAVIGINIWPYKT